MKAANETKVGAVVIAAIALAIIGYFYFRGVGLRTDTYYLQVQQATTIAEGADVRLQGIKIGIVRRIILDGRTQKPLLTLSVNRHKPPYQLRKNYTYSISSASLLGEKYVDIRGSAVGYSDVYIPNDPSETINARVTDFTAVTDDLSEGIRDTLSELSVTLRKINEGVLSTENQAKLTEALEGIVVLTQQASKSMGDDGFKIALGDEKSAQALRTTLENTAAASKTADDMTRLANALLQRNQRNADAIIANLEKTTRESGKTFETLNSVLKESGLQEKSPQILTSLNNTAKNIEVASDSLRKLGSGNAVKTIEQSLAALQQSSNSMRDATLSIKALLTDSTTQGQFKSTFASMQQISATLEETTKNLNQASAGLNGLLSDAQLQEDLKASAAELHKTLQSTSAAAARINHLVGGKTPAQNSDLPDVKQTDDSTKAESTPNRRSGLDFTYRYLSKEEKPHRGDLTLNTRLFDAPFRLGLSDIGEGNHLTLQTGAYIGDGDIRYGLYRSKLGVGADYYWKRFSLEGNLWDPNHKSWNAYVGMKVSPHAEILLGKEKNKHVRNTSIGVRLSR